MRVVCYSPRLIYEEGFGFLMAAERFAATVPPKRTAVDRLDSTGAVLTMLIAPDGKKDTGQWKWAAPVEGKTRLVKEIFLTAKETRTGVAGLYTFQFTPGPYGPSSLELTNTLDKLLAGGLVVGESFAGGKGVRLRLSGAGGKLAIGIWGALSQAARTDIYRVKAQSSSKSLKELLVYVYRTYPEFTTNSLIRDEVLSDLPND